MASSPTDCSHERRGLCNLSLMSDEQSSRRRVRVDGDTRPKTPDTAPSEPLCECPHLDAEDWHEVESDWSDIQFIRGSLPAVAGVPVGYQSIRGKLRKRAEAAGAVIPEDAMLLLGEGRLRRPVLLEVETDGAHPGIEMPGGFAWTRLLPAHFGAMKGLMRETKEQAKEKYGREPDEMWVWYLTCSECSEPREWETLFVAHYRPD